MLKVELGNKKSKTKDKYVIVNDVEDLDSTYSDIHYPSVFLYNDDVIDILIGHSFREVGEHFTKLHFSYDYDWWDSSVSIEIICNKSLNDNFPALRIDLQLQDWEHWAKPWSMASVAKQLEINVKHLKNNQVIYWQDDEDSMLNGFGIEYFPESELSTIDIELDKVLTLVESLALQTNQDLLASIDTNAVVTFFQFPEEAKTACKQYLIYFAQFLADLGIQADTEIKEELSHTLFKVIPTDKNESLEQIRQALDLYLNAPSDSSLSTQTANQSDISIRQWEANIFHLKSQLALATSIIQAKETTIEMLQLSNYQYKQLLETSKSNKDENKEDVIKGIVTVDKYEGKGFTINIAELLRRLKRTIGK